jgi:hypothetical protein
MSIRFPLLAIAVFAWTLSVPIEHASLAQTQVTINASKDNTLYEDAAGALSNGAGEFFFVGRTNQGSGSIRRGLIAFNIAGNIPPGATITSVTLRLNMSKTNSGATTVNLHRATADWGEGTSNAGANEGSGAPATTGDATWLHRFFNSTLWTTPGGTFVSTPSASQSVDNIGTYTWGSTAAMVSDAQQWLTTPSSNFGWLILGNESAAATSKRFNTRENNSPTSRPVLTVTYTTTGVGEEQGSPKTFVLHQNYPNPFNPSTNIGFRIVNFGFVSLKVFDVLGQEVATLVNEKKSPGTYEIEWNAGGFPGGMYFCRLQVSGEMATRKLVLLP